MPLTRENTEFVYNAVYLVAIVSVLVSTSEFLAKGTTRCLSHVYGKWLVEKPAITSPA